MTTINSIDRQRIGSLPQSICDALSDFAEEAKADVAALEGDVAAIQASSPFVVDEWTNPAAAAAAGLKAATATVASPVTVSSFLAGGVAALLAYPRNLTFTTAGGTPSDAPATALVTGTDINNDALTETVTLAQTATIANGVKAFKTVTSVEYPAADGTDATVSIGFGSVFGLSMPIQSRAGRLAVIQEVAVGTVVTTGTFVNNTTSPPNGSYAPATAPDGSRDYAVTYEQQPIS